MAVGSTLLNVPTSVVEAPLIEPVVGEIGNLAAASRASRQICTRTFLPAH